MDEVTHAGQKSQRSVIVGVITVVALLMFGFVFKKVLSVASCSKLSEQVATASANALAGSMTAESILAARDAARARADTAGLGAVTVETAN